MKNQDEVQAHRIAAAIEACPAAREARRKAYEAVKARNLPAAERYADEAGAALLAIDSDLAPAEAIGMMIGAQVFAMLEGWQPIEAGPLN